MKNQLEKNTYKWSTMNKSISPKSKLITLTGEKNITNEEALTTEQEISYKICTWCKQKKEITFFYKRYNRDAFDSWCKDCKNKEQKHRWSLNAIAFVRRIYQGLNRQRKNSRRAECLISLSEFLDVWQEQYQRFGMRCPYSGIEMTHTLGVGKTLYNISIDRIDNTKPYIDDNLVFCCAIINRMKNILSLKDFMMICKTIAKNNMVEHLTS